jgi:alpha,alpha-trehalose phosphorylase
VIKHPVFHVEPWCLREKALDLDVLAQTESIFALSNGHIGWRANLDEGEPHGLPGSYLNGVYESSPLVPAEAAYGLPESGQTVINVTNGKVIRLFVDDEPFDVRYGTLRSHERVLDFRSGVLSRRAEWVSPAGGAVRVSSARLVSFTQRSIAAVRYEVEPLDGPVRIALQSELLANEQGPAETGDPRHGVDINHPLVEEFHSARDQAAVLVHRTARSGLRVGAAMDHLVDGPDVRVESQSFADGAVVTVAAVVAPGQRLSVIKFVGYGWSACGRCPAYGIRYGQP